MRDEMWDDPESIGTSDPDELAPTVKVIPFPKMAYDERTAYDSRSLETVLRYQGVAA